MLRTLEETKQSHWQEYLSELVQAYNNTVYSGTGYAPAFLMFGHHLRLPVDAVLGVASEQPRQDMSGWVRDHQEKLSAVYRKARQRMHEVASQHMRHYDNRYKALPLIPGERVWVRDRNRRGRGKLCTWWKPQPHQTSGGDWIGV